MEHQYRRANKITRMPFILICQISQGRILSRGKAYKLNRPHWVASPLQRLWILIQATNLSTWLLKWEVNRSLSSVPQRWQMFKNTGVKRPISTLPGASERQYACQLPTLGIWTADKTEMCLLAQARIRTAYKKALQLLVSPWWLM